MCNLFSTSACPDADDDAVGALFANADKRAAIAAAAFALASTALVEPVGGGPGGGGGTVGGANGLYANVGGEGCLGGDGTACWTGALVLIAKRRR